MCASFCGGSRFPGANHSTSLGACRHRPTSSIMITTSTTSPTIHLDQPFVRYSVPRSDLVLTHRKAWSHLSGYCIVRLSSPGVVVSVLLAASSKGVEGAGNTASLASLPPCFLLSSTTITHPAFVQVSRASCMSFCTSQSCWINSAALQRSPGQTWALPLPNQPNYCN